MAILQFFPLSIFLIISRSTGNWPLSFQISGVLAFLQTVFLLWRKKNLDRFMLGINAFLAIGAFAFFFNLYDLELNYANFRETGFFISLIAVGILSTVFSPRGFVNAEPATAKRKTIVGASVILLFATGGAVAFSQVYRGQPILSGTLPFILLIILRRILLKAIVSPVGKDNTQ